MEPVPREVVLGLLQRLSAYSDLRIIGNYIYHGSELIATVHGRNTGQLQHDLLSLFALSPRLLSEYISLASRANLM